MKVSGETHHPSEVAAEAEEEANRGAKEETSEEMDDHNNEDKAGAREEAEASIDQPRQ